METYDIAVIGGGPAEITLAKMLGHVKKMVIIRPGAQALACGVCPSLRQDIKSSVKSDQGANNRSGERMSDSRIA